MKKKTALLFVMLPASALFAQGPRMGGGGPGGPMGRGPGMPGGGAVISGAPYSGTEVVQSSETLGDGNVIQRKRSTNVYRDSSGRVRTEETITPDASTGKAPFTRTTILDYVGGKRYELDSSTMIAHESPLHAPPARPASAVTTTGGPQGRRGNGTTNAGTTAGTAQSSALRPSVVRTELTTQSVNGVLAAGTQHSETIPVGAIGNARPIQTSRITWVSNDLKIPVRIQSSDPRFGSTDMELTNIIQSEPSSALFVVPAGYTVKTGGPGFGGPPGGGPGGDHSRARGPHQAPPQR